MGWDTEVLARRTLDSDENGYFVVLKSAGDGSFQMADFYPVPGRYPTRITSGDFNRDHCPDLAIACGSNDAGRRLNTIVFVPNISRPVNAIHGRRPPFGIVEPTATSTAASRRTQSSSSVRAPRASGASRPSG